MVCLLVSMIFKDILKKKKKKKSFFFFNFFINIILLVVSVLFFSRVGPFFSLLWGLGFFLC